MSLASIFQVRKLRFLAFDISYLFSALFCAIGDCMVFKMI